MKGIILAGGAGTRLYPITLAPEQAAAPRLRQAHGLLPALDAHAGGHPRDPRHLDAPRPAPLFESFWATARSGGSTSPTPSSPRPSGLAQAFLIGEDFLGGSPACLVLGDNIFYGHGLVDMLRGARDDARQGGAIVFGYRVRDPERYGVVEFDDERARPLHRGEAGRASLELRGARASTSTTSESATWPSRSTPSARGELEITDVNNLYLEDGSLSVRLHEPGHRLARHRHPRVADGGE